MQTFSGLYKARSSRSMVIIASSVQDRLTIKMSPEEAKQSLGHSFGREIGRKQAKRITKDAAFHSV